MMLSEARKRLAECVKRAAQFSETEKKRLKIVVRVALVVLFFLALPLWIAYSAGYRLTLNVSPSLDDHLYLTKMTPPNEIEKGTIVIFSMRLIDTPYDRDIRRFPLMKNILCLPNEHLERVGDRWFCDGKEIVVVGKKDSRGNDYVVSFDYNGSIPQDKYFVAGSHPFSFDSRYYGLIDKQQLLGVVKWVIF